MKISQYLCTLVIALSTSFAFAGSGISFKNISLEEAKALAAESNKLIFVDAYADWCGPCKWMAANTFTDDEVAEFYNNNVISLQIDMESEMGMEFDLRYNVDAYPTLLFLNAEGAIVKRYTGALDASEFLRLGQLVVDPSASKVKPLEAKILGGNHDEALVLEYMLACSDENEEPKNAIVDVYLALLERKGRADADFIGDYLVEVQMYDRVAADDLVLDYFNMMDDNTLIEDEAFTIFYFYQNDLDAPSTLFFIENYEEIASVWGSYAQEKFTDLIVNATEDYKRGNLRKDKIYTFVKLFADQNGIEYEELKTAVDELLEV